MFLIQCGLELQFDVVMSKYGHGILLDNNCVINGKGGVWTAFLCTLCKYKSSMQILFQ